jgi:sRNA-binding protein
MNQSRPILRLSKPKKALTVSVETPKSFRQMRKELQARWPFLFDKEHPVPLAIGVDVDVARRTGFDRKRVCKFLAYWTHRTKYLNALEHYDHRVDLDGNIC